MADETTQNTPITSEETEKTTVTTEVTPPAAGETAETPTETKIFTQADLDRIAANVRTEEKRKFDKKAADEKTAATQQQLKESGEFKTLYEGSQARVQELERELETEKLGAVRAEVAAEYRLPKIVADRLRGTTRDEMTADAKELAKVAAGPRAPTGENGAPPPTDPKKLAEQELTRAKQTGRYSAF